MADFPEKDWKDKPDYSTPVNAAALEDMERRLSEYAASEVASLAATVASKSRLEVNLLDYADLNTSGGADASSVINQAISDVSAAAIAAGVRRATLYVPRPVVLRLDSNVLFQPRVSLDMDESRWVAGADFGATLGGMFRAVPSAQNPSASVGSATTTNGSKLLTSVAQIQNFYPEMVISGTGIPAGTKVTAVSYTTNTVGLDTAATASGTVTISRAATYYGSKDDIRLIGGEIDPNGKRVGPIVRALYTNRFQVIGTRILHNLPEAYSNWALQLGGRNGLVSDVDIVGGQWEFSDGIHIYHGQHWRVDDCDVQSGDDMVAIGGEPGDALDVEPDPIRHVTVSNLTGRSNMAMAVKVYVPSGNTGRDWEVTDITVDNVNAHAAVTDNGAIRCKDYNDTAAGTSQIKRVRMSNLDLVAGSSFHRDQNLHQLIHCASVDDASFTHITGTMTDKASPTNGFDVVRIEKSRDVTVDKMVVNGQPKRYGFHATDSIRPKLRNSTIIGSSDSANPVRLSSCTDFEVIGNHLEPGVAGQSAIRLNEGTGSTGKIRHNTVRRGDGNCYLLLHTAAAVDRLDVDDNDTTGANRAFESTSEWESTTRPTFPLTAPRRIMTAKNRFDASAALTTTLNESGAGAFSGASPWFGAMYIDPADFKKGARTAKCRLELLIAVNDTAPACNIGIALAAISAPAGVAAKVEATQGSTVSGSTITATTPAANSLTRTTADFTLPSAGWYVITATIGTGGMAPNSSALVRGTLSYVEGAA